MKKDLPEEGRGEEFIILSKKSVVHRIFKVFGRQLADDLND